MVVVQQVQKIIFVLLLTVVSSIVCTIDKPPYKTIPKIPIASQAVLAKPEIGVLDEDLNVQSSKHSQIVSVSEQTHPNSCRYVQTILRSYPDKVSEVLFVIGSDRSLQSYKSILMIPYAWLSGLEQQDIIIDEIIQNYIKNQMQSLTAWINRIDWDKVSIGLIVVCLTVIAVHLYKIEKTMSRIDNQIKSNTLFWLCTLPTKMMKQLQGV